MPYPHIGVHCASLACFSMNLSIVKELSTIYKEEDFSTLNLSKLELVCSKLKNSKKATSPQLASACWNLLVQLNRIQSRAFYSIDLFYLTAKVIIYSAIAIDSAQSEFKMGNLDLDKLVANLISKLTDGLKSSLCRNHTQAVHIVDLMQLIFDRLSKHSDSCLATDLRRISLIDHDSLNDLFIDIKFAGLSPAVLKNDPVLIQLSAVALESLCHLLLAFNEGSLETVMKVLVQFHLQICASDSSSGPRRIAHFINSLCKLEFWSHLEWNLWVFFSSHEIYHSQLYFFRKRCNLVLTTPSLDVLSELSMGICAALLENDLHTDIVLLSLQSCPRVYNDEIIGACLSLISKEDFKINVNCIDEILSRTPRKKVSDCGLRSILSSLDSMRNNLPCLIRRDSFFYLICVLNQCLVHIELPSKYYVSWTSSVLKFALETRRSDPQLRSVSKACINGLLECFDYISEEIKPKVCKIVCMAVSSSSDKELLLKVTTKFDDSLLSILEYSCFNLLHEYFIVLSRIVFSKPFSESVVLSWIKVLMSQIRIDVSAFQFKDVYYAHSVIKMLCHHVIDPVKLSLYLDLIYKRLDESKCNEQVLILSKQLISIKFTVLKWPFRIDYKFKNPNINVIIGCLASLVNTCSVDFNTFSFELINSDDSLEQELINYSLNYLLIHAKKDEFKSVLDQMEGDILVNSMNHIIFDHDTNWENSLTNRNNIVKSIHDIYKLVCFKYKFSIFFYLLGKTRRSS
jgi:hypothetical protein